MPSFGGTTSNARELVLAIVATVAVVLCVVFLGLYAAKPSGGNNSKQNDGVTAALQSNTTTSAPPTGKICGTHTCLESTAYVWYLLNQSVDPCTDFYSYACGNWPKKFPLAPNQYRNDVRREIYFENEKKLRKLLDSPKLRDVPWGAERKAKALYGSCLNEYGRMSSGGKPFLDKVLNKVGGWYVLGNFDSSTWDLLANLEKVHVDFWTDVFFKIQVRTDYRNRNRQVITLNDGGLGVSSWTYTSPYFTRVRAAYQGYIRKLGELLVRDSGLNISDHEKVQRLDTFVNDTMTVETMLARLRRSSSFNRNHLDRSEQVRIRDLKSLTNSTFNWESFFSYLFDTASISEWTFVSIPRKDYISAMADGINNMGTDKNRMLNNYFTWQLLMTYGDDLSAEYIQAGREFINKRFGVTEFLETWENCFRYVANNMREALSHIYVGAHFTDGNKDKVTEIAGYVKDALVNTLSNQSFMDQETKRRAKNKVRQIVDKLGHPDYMADTDSVDLIFSSLEVHDSDYFQNVLNMNKFRKTDLNSLLSGRNYERIEWPYSAYNTFAFYFRNWNQLLVPAGMLQHPIYDYHLPHYLNFGSMGTMVAGQYINAVDRYGSYYDVNGNRVYNRTGSYRGWWSPTTWNNYSKVQQCMADYFTNRTIGSYIDPDTGRTMPVIILQRTAAGVDDVWEVQVAAEAYKEWVKKNGEEPMPPSIGLTNQQMYFIAYAQSQCYVYDDWLQYLYGRYGSLSKAARVNGAVAQLKEFSDAFQCPSNAPLNPTKKCTVV